LQELIAFLAELQAKGIDLYLHRRGIDTVTPIGRAMFQTMATFAKFERGMIVERVKAGLARARSQGTRLRRRPVSADVVNHIRERLPAGAGIAKTAIGARDRDPDSASREARDGGCSGLILSGSLVPEILNL